MFLTREGQILPTESLVCMLLSNLHETKYLLMNTANNVQTFVTSRSFCSQRCSKKWKHFTSPLYKFSCLVFVVFFCILKSLIWAGPTPARGLGVSWAGQRRPKGRSRPGRGWSTSSETSRQRLVTYQCLFDCVIVIIQTWSGIVWVDGKWE